jgi:hypothetical protein
MNNYTRGTTALVRMGDMGAIIYGGYPMYKYELTRTTKQEAKNRFLRATILSQQSGLKSSQSSLQNNANPLAKTFMRFKNTMNQYTRKIADKLINYHNGEATASEVAKTFFIYHAYAAFAYVALGAGVTGLFKSIGNIIRDDDEEPVDYPELGSDLIEQVVIHPFLAIPVLDDLSRYTYRKATDRKTYGYTFETPMMGDIWSAMNKLTKQEPDFRDYLDAISSLQELKTGLGTNVFLRHWDMLFKERVKKQTQEPPKLPKLPQLPSL